MCCADNCKFINKFVKICTYGLLLYPAHTLLVSFYRNEIVCERRETVAKHTYTDRVVGFAMRILVPGLSLQVHYPIADYILFTRCEPTQHEKCFKRGYSYVSFALLSQKKFCHI